MNFSLAFPGCSHPGLVVAPSPGFDFSGLVAWSLLSPRSWKPPSQSTPFSRSVSFWHLCGAGYSPPPCFLAYCGALWLLALRSRHCRITTGLASMDRPLLVSALWVLFVVLPRQLVGSGVYSPASPICPTSSGLKRSSFGISASGFRVKSSRWGHPSGSNLSQSSIGTKSLPPPSWCLVGVFAMGSPCRVGVVSDLDRNEDSLRTFPSGWFLAFAMGSPISGRVALFCALDRNEGFFRSSILSCFAMGSPCGSCVFFRTLDRNEAYFG